jgi:putative DNA methylase
VSEEHRLIEDLIPVDAINEVAQREKIGHATNHPRKLHLWWARRPLAAARAAVYATLVNADETPAEKRSATYFRELCRWGASEEAIADARARVLAANDGKPPRVLDMFAGGGAIPLEAARLGCEATAVELNPVAHLIELCMLDYPQRFGPSLADDVRKWGQSWVKGTWDRIGHLYPAVEGDSHAAEQLDMAGEVDEGQGRLPTGYLWTRTVHCPNPTLGSHEIPLVRQTWLVRKKNRSVALRPVVDKNRLTVSWEVMEAVNKDGLGFDPSSFSSRGKATCIICGTGIDAEYVKQEGMAGRLGVAPLAAVVPHESGRGRRYLAAGDYPLPDNRQCEEETNRSGVEPPDQPLPAKLTGGMCTVYGLTRFRDLFTPRQLATLCTLVEGVHDAHTQMVAEGIDPDRAQAVSAFLGLALDRLVDRSTSLCVWDTTREGVANTYSRQALPMVWDFVETNPFGGSLGDIGAYVSNIGDIVELLSSVKTRCEVQRTSATQLPDHDSTYDAVITDPPYYDNISYADLSDFFYVWLKRSVGFLFPEHFGGELTPKRREAIAAPYRHDGDKTAARKFYEHEMETAFREAHRVLKPGAPLVCVYAHKTTLGWAALVEALRRAGFVITEAWPLDTEMTTALKAKTASLASSVFLVARRREKDEIGHHSEVVRDLDSIVTERLERLTEAGVAGSDLLIAGIGAGLRAFTSYARVDLPNGEEVPAESFLEEVQSRVLNAVLRQIHGLENGVGAIDPTTRYYVISRFSFGYSPIAFDEANNLARSSGVELDKLGAGPAPLAELKKNKVRLLDYSERGNDAELGLTGNGPDRAPLIDVLHGLLWRAGHRRDEMRDYLAAAHADGAKLRVVAQALQGPALRGGGESKPNEAQACERVLGAWKTLVDDNLMSQ